MALDHDRQRDERYGARREFRTLHCPPQKTRFLVDILHDGQLAIPQDTAGDPFAKLVTAAIHLLRRQSVRVPDPTGVFSLVAQDDPSSVQAEQFGHQVQHFAKDRMRRKALADERHHLLQQQHFMLAPIDGGFDVTDVLIGSRIHKTFSVQMREVLFQGIKNKNPERCDATSAW
jgi:hypothetical protein